MEYYAEKALYNLRHSHDWKSYETSQIVIETKYINQFNSELNALKELITKK